MKKSLLLIFVFTWSFYSTYSQFSPKIETGFSFSGLAPNTSIEDLTYNGGLKIWAGYTITPNIQAGIEGQFIGFYNKHITESDSIQTSNSSYEPANPLATFYDVQKMEYLHVSYSIGAYGQYTLLPLKGFSPFVRLGVGMRSLNYFSNLFIGQSRPADTRLQGTSGNMEISEEIKGSFQNLYNTSSLSLNPTLGIDFRIGNKSSFIMSGTYFHHLNKIYYMNFQSFLINNNQVLDLSYKKTPLMNLSVNIGFNFRIY